MIEPDGGLIKKVIPLTLRILPTPHHLKEMTQGKKHSRSTLKRPDGKVFSVYRDETVSQELRNKADRLLEKAISNAPREDWRPALAADTILDRASRNLFAMARKRANPPPEVIYSTLQSTAFWMLVKSANRLNAMVSILQEEEPEIARLIGSSETRWPVSISDIPNMEASLQALIEAVRLGIDYPLYDTARAKRKPSVAKDIVTGICRLSDALLILNVQSQALQMERRESDAESIRSARSIRNASWRDAILLIRTIAQFLEVSHELTRPRPLLKIALTYSMHPGRVTTDTIDAWATVVRHFVDILCSGEPEKNPKMRRSIAKSKQEVKRHIKESLEARRKRSADNVRAGMYDELRRAIKSIAWK